MNCLYYIIRIFDLHKCIGYVCGLLMLSCCPSTEFGVFRPPEFDDWMCWDSLVSILSMPSAWWTTLLKYLSIKRTKTKWIQTYILYIKHIVIYSVNYNLIAEKAKNCCLWSFAKEYIFPKKKKFLLLINHGFI